MVYVKHDEEGLVVDNDADDDTHCDSDEDPLEWEMSDGDGLG